MGRWEPNARGRLAQTALMLYAERGFEQTTVAEIAQRAGLTERTFFRHFADKREVLFYGAETMEDHLATAIAAAPAEATPMQAVSAAIEAICALFEEDPDRVRQRDAVVSANAELRERELIKLARLVETTAGALRRRGVSEPSADLAAEAGFAVFKVAVARWMAAPGKPSLPAIFRLAMQELRGVLADRAA